MFGRAKPTKASVATGLGGGLRTKPGGRPHVRSGDSKRGAGWAMAPHIFACPPQFFHNFLFKFVWLTYTVENFRPTIFQTII